MKETITAGDIGVINAADFLPEKPPTIRVGVEGIASAKQTTAEELQKQATNGIDWQRLFGLPAFQMFAVELTDRSPVDFDGWMPELLKQIEESIGPEAFYADYCEWHKAKGRWPNEDPMGRLIE